MSLFPEVYDHFILDEDSKQLVAAFVLKHASKTKVLDCGCGTGWLSFLLAKANYQVDGFDVDEAMLTYASTQYHHPNIRYFQTDMRTLSLETKYDSILIMTDGLNYFTELDDLKSFLTTCARHLAPTGRIIFDVYDPSVLKVFQHEYLEEKIIHESHVQWSIQSLESHLSHYIKITNSTTLEQNLHYLERIFDPKSIESHLTSLDFQFEMFYDFDDTKKKGLKRVYVARRT